MLKHRSDIDGLRAVAVLMVIVFHAFPDLIPGGFVGVDIFFVISGYLIGGILIKAAEDGTFSFVDFYARRIRRIFPALIIVLAFCMAFGWRVLLADEYRQLAEQAVSGSLFSANILLWLKTGYFDPAAALKPLLHLWSLGVEEQFYIVWPPILLLAYRLRWNVGVVALVLGVISFALNIHTIHADPAGAFYLPQTRIWEPLIGCALAWLSTHRPASSMPNIAAWSGAVLIAAAVVVLDSAAPFPGWRALLPTLGAALLIWAGPEALLNRIVLSNSPMVWIGLISYPLYLWHWPLLSFARICAGAAPGVSERIELLGASFVMAGLTYLAIEKHVRYRRSKLVPASLATLMLFIATGSYATYSENGYPKRVERFARIEAALGQWDYPTGDMTTTQFGGYPVRELDSHIADKVLFLGDSNVEQYWPRIQHLVTTEPNRVKSVVFMTWGGCPPIVGVTDTMNPSCSGWIDSAFKYAYAGKFDTIVIASNWIGDFNFAKSQSLTSGGWLGPLSSKEGLDHAMESMKNSILKLRASGTKHVILVLNIPNDPHLNSRNLLRRSLGGFRIEEGGIARTGFADRYDRVRAAMVKMASEAGATTIDPMDYLCPNGFCAAWYGDGGDPIYKDGDHLSAAFVRNNATFIDQTIAVR